MNSNVSVITETGCLAECGKQPTQRKLSQLNTIFAKSNHTLFFKLKNTFQEKSLTFLFSDHIS